MTPRRSFLWEEQSLSLHYRANQWLPHITCRCGLGGPTWALCARRDGCHVDDIPLCEQCAEETRLVLVLALDSLRVPRNLNESQSITQRGVEQPRERKPADDKKPR